MTPLACDREAVTAAERPRYNELVKKLKSAVKQQRELDSGYAWELDGNRVALTEAAEWIAMERRCCPFLTLQLEAAGNRSDYWLKLEGPAGAKEFLTAEFQIGS